MPSVGTSPSAPVAQSQPAGVRYGPALALLASLFFMWGFITVINNTLLPHLRSVFELNYTQTTLIESVWFIAYFVASIPSAKLIEWVGYKKSLVIGLLTMAAGAVGMMLAAMIPSYGVTLVMLFIIASGITLLQVAANPYVAVCGKPETASARLNLVQALNSMGTMLAPMFGAYLILGRTKGGTAAEGAVALTQAERLADAQSVILPYALVAGVLVVLAIIIARFPLPAMVSESDDAKEKRKHIINPELFKHRNLVFGIPAIFIYLIAEIGVGNLFINFVSRPDIGNMSLEQAGHYLTFLWGGMMVGRFVGSAIMSRFDAAHVLAVFSVGAFITMLVTSFADGHVAMWSLILVGLFHSIMFPTIFTLGIKGLGPLTEEASGLLVMAIAGGALVFVQGWIADAYDLQTSFLLTAACELYVLFYALWGSKPTHAEPEPEPEPDALFD
ncbi:sugar MFS transporter [Novosphingobium decolorationis]|uniref:Sugar MFS transporter n=1 Tax=Novosphingobium decolorationis TaxID=2698673 RepID=A0ABX8E2V8_9SPHN|nr:sugar MFS transporter [Novosphingobium decolorationis]QVM83477.1 sugar MFS transporter [Novosphingobium decolorationis]